MQSVLHPFERPVAQKANERPFILRALPVLSASAAAGAMIYLSRRLGLPQIALPTFGALLTGTWLVRDNLWHYSKRRLFLSLLLSSAAGVLLSRLSAAGGELWIYPAVYAAFLATAAILIAGRTQIYPCFGAAILPILFQTTSWLYPAAVCAMALVLCAGRAVFERLGALRPLNPSGFCDLPEHRKARAIYYLQISLGLLPALVFVPLFGDHFLLLPPLFVTYASFCNQHSSFARYPASTWIQLCLAFAFGSCAVFAASRSASSMPQTEAAFVMGLAAALCVSITIAVGQLFHKLFPPAVSLALTPFLIGVYPPCLIYVPIMSAYFLFIAGIMRAHPAYKNRDLHYI